MQWINNFMTYHNYIHQNPKLLQAMHSMLLGLHSTHFVTLTFNQSNAKSSEQKLDYARHKLKYFHAKLDRCLLGSDWNKKPKEDRTFFIAFPEKIETNIHYHLLMTLDEKHHMKFKENAEKIWKKIVDSGTFDAKLLKDAPDANGYKSYVTKEQNKSLNFNSFIISHEFVNI